MRFGVRGSRREIRNEKISILGMAPAHFFTQIEKRLAGIRRGSPPPNTKEGTPLRMSLWFKEHNEESLQSPS